MRAFEAGEGGRFYGRSRESLELSRLWRARKLTVLYGTSGVGKTSLLQAGVLPALDEAGCDTWPIGRVRYPDDPGSVGARNPYSFALLSSWAPDEPPSSLSGVTIAGFLERRQENLDSYGDPIPLLAAIDQFEEVFSGLPDGQPYVRPFISELAEALNSYPGLRLLVSLREDYLAAMLPFEPLLAGQSRNRLQLLPFGRAAAMEAITGPLRDTGRSFAPGTAEQLVEDLSMVRFTDARGAERSVRVDAIEPVQVQIVCAALWESLPPAAAVITSEDVRKHANVDRFLADFCSRALTAVAVEQRISATEIRSWLQRTFITELGTRGTAYQGLDQTAGMPNAVVLALEDQHILRAEHRSYARWYELQHDRLVEPLLQADPKEHLEAARAASARGEWESVERHAKLAIRVYGTDDLRVRAEAEYLLGEAVQHTGHEPDARAHYITAASLFEVLQDSALVGRALAAAGRLAVRHGRYAEAAEDLRAAMSREPGNLDVQADLALALWHTGQPRSCEAVLNSLLAANRTMLTALSVRGELLADMDKSADALADLDLVRHQQTPSIQAARALALAGVGRNDAAEEEAADALANGGDNGPVLWRVARVREMTGHHAEAVQLASEALMATSPGLPPHLRHDAQAFLG